MGGSAKIPTKLDSPQLLLIFLIKNKDNEENEEKFFPDKS